MATRTVWLTDRRTDVNRAEPVYRMYSCKGFLPERILRVPTFGTNRKRSKKYSANLVEF